MDNLEADNVDSEEVRDSSILKPKRKLNLTDEQREKRRESMLKVNAERVRKSQETKEKLQKEKEEELKRLSSMDNQTSNEKVGKTPKATIQNKKIEKLERTIQTIKQLKGIATPQASLLDKDSSNPTVARLKARDKPRKKQIVLEVSSSESESDYSDEDEPEVILVQKQSTFRKAGGKSKPRKESNVVMDNTICRFI